MTRKIETLTDEDGGVTANDPVQRVRVSVSGDVVNIGFGAKDGAGVPPLRMSLAQSFSLRDVLVRALKKLPNDEAAPVAGKVV